MRNRKHFFAFTIVIALLLSGCGPTYLIQVTDWKNKKESYKGSFPTEESCIQALNGKVQKNEADRKNYFCNGKPYMFEENK